MVEAGWRVFFFFFFLQRRDGAWSKSGRAARHHRCFHYAHPCDSQQGDCAGRFGPFQVLHMIKQLNKRKKNAIFTGLF